MPQSIEKLFEGVELSENAKKQINEAFETALNEKAEEKAKEIVAERAEVLEAEFKTKLDEAVEQEKQKIEEANEKLINEEIIPSINEKVSAYLKYTISEWQEENKIAIDEGIKVEMAEKILESHKTLLQTFGVCVNEDEALKNTQKSLDEVKADLDKAISKNSDLSEEVEKLKRNIVIQSVVSERSLAETQKEKLIKMSEKLSFKDEESFKEKINEVCESEFIKGEDNKEKLKEEISEDYKNPYLAELSKRLKNKTI